MALPFKSYGSIRQRNTWWRHRHTDTEGAGADTRTRKNDKKQASRYFSAERPQNRRADDIRGLWQTLAKSCFHGGGGENRGSGEEQA